MDYLPSSDFNPYDTDELRRAGRVLIQEVEYGPLQWLNSRLQQNSFDSNVRFPSVWEGTGGMMEHVYDHFPMPPCTYYQEQPVTDLYDRGHTGWLSHDSTSQQLCQVESTDFSDMSTSYDFVGRKFTGTHGYNDSSTESKIREDAKKDDRSNRHEINFWEQVSKMYDRLGQIGEAVSKAQSKLCKVNEKERKEACQLLVDSFVKLKPLGALIEEREKIFIANGYKNIFKIMSLPEKTKYKHRFGIVGLLPNRFRCIKNRFEKLKKRFGKIVHEDADIIEPYKDILHEVLKDLILESGEGSTCLFSTKSLRTSKIGNSGDTFEEPLRDSDVVSVFNNDQDLFTSRTRSGHKAYTPSRFIELNTDERLIRRKFEKQVMWNSIEEVRSTQSGVQGCDVHLLDNNAEINYSFESSDSEEMFWRNVASLKNEIVTVLFRTHELKNKPRRAPTKKTRRQMDMSLCNKIVNVHQKLCSCISLFNQLAEEKKTNNYGERGPLDTDSVKFLRKRNYTPDCISLEMVEAFLNKLKSAYMQVRVRKRQMLQKLRFISGANDLVICTGNDDKKLVRICAHSESNVFVNILTSKKCFLPISEISRDLRQASHETDLHQASSYCKIYTGYFDTNHDRAPVSCSEVDDSAFSNNWRASEDNFSTHCPSGSTEDMKKTSNFPQSTVSKRKGPDFLEKEKYHWDVLQKLYNKIDSHTTYFLSSSKRFSIGNMETHDTMNSYKCKLNKLSRTIAIQKSESCRAGYCKVVTYRNLELQSQKCARLVVTSLDEVESRLNTLYEHFRNAAKTFQLYHFCE